MWYEIIPSFAIITAGLGVPGWALYHIHNLTLGNHHKRSVDTFWQRRIYQRDMRITGSPYVVNGLDSLPDK
ncbi:uncharacterized protein LOC123692750 [Colias croceus]|uniref:uncharacterized protein LOC123692750 n=1 Tax=Colias crocea TaxID=72248 RepID=UPI001E27AD0B|nr:uncharacterized protein LOC123692750 [Colias croceus]CAG4953705.1 unnamed protein product [Colias eurytheme]